MNILYPDENATYWGARVPIPQGGHIELDGAFPHARYLSLISYTSPQLEAIDIVRDTDIVPDPGSTNPFLPGSDRGAAGRDFTVRIVDGPAPESGRERNTLYTENAQGMKTDGYAQFVLRIYLPDLGTGLTGGVPLPEITVVLASGERVTYPRCDDVGLPHTGTTSTLAAAGAGEPLPVLELTSPPRWHKFTGGGASLAGMTENDLTGDTVYPLLKEATQSDEPQGGLGDTPDNRYVYTVYGADWGQVFAFHAKAPTFPSTSGGEPVMQGGQVRYWSICSNLSTTQYLACRYDEQVPLDEDGFYTIAVSTSAARPRNATEACGVAWLPAGPTTRTVLALRNLLPDGAFTQSTHAARPDSEAQDMGPYYPGGHYYPTTADFERLGCPAEVAAGTGHEDDDQ